MYKASLKLILLGNVSLANLRLGYNNLHNWIHNIISTKVKLLRKFLKPMPWDKITVVNFSI